MARSSATDADAGFLAVYQEHYPLVTAFARRRVHVDSVEDVVADVFTVVWRRWEEVCLLENPLPWIYGVAHRIVSQHYRSGSRWQSLVDRVAQTTPATAQDDDLVADEQVGAVLARMRPYDRNLMMLRYWEDLSTTDIAVVVDKSYRNVLSGLHRARERFRAIWEKEISGDGRSPFAGESP